MSSTCFFSRTFAFGSLMNSARAGPNEGDLSRMKALGAEIMSSKGELEQLKARSAEVEVAIKDLEQKILDIGGSHLLKQKSTVEGIKLHINLANDEITKAEVAKAKATKDLTRYGTAIQSNTAGFQEAEAELEELDGTLEELRTYVTQLRAKVEDAQEAANSSKEDLDNLKAEVDAKDQEIAEFRKKEVCSSHPSELRRLIVHHVVGNQTTTRRC